MTDMEKMKSIKSKLVDCVLEQMENLDKADTHQLGQAIDMIKDMAETIYYCTITWSMEHPSEQKKSVTK